MTRRVKLAFIENESASRRAEYKKKRREMMKKLDELSTHCGTEACALVYKPNDPKLDVLLPHQGVQRVSSSFMDEENHLKQRIKETKELLKKQRIEQEKKEKTFRFYQYLGANKIPNNLSLDDLKDIRLLIDQQMMGIEQTIAQKMYQSQTTVVAPVEPDHGAAKNKGKVPVDVDGAMEKQH